MIGNKKGLRMKKKKKIKNNIISKKHDHLKDKLEDQALLIRKDTAQKEGKVQEGADLLAANMTEKIDLDLMKGIGTGKEKEKGIEIGIEVEKKKEVKKVDQEVEVTEKSEKNNLDPIVDQEIERYPHKSKV